MVFIFQKITKSIVGVTDDKELSRFPEELKKDYYTVDCEDFFKGCKTDEEKINKMLKSAMLFHDNWFNGNDFVVEIEWGDWKHDHLFTDDLMKVLGYTGTEEVTEEDGSDCYSAIHTYKKGEKENDRSN